MFLFQRLSMAVQRGNVACFSGSVRHQLFYADPDNSQRERIGKTLMFTTNAEAQSSVHSSPLTVAQNTANQTAHATNEGHASHATHYQNCDFIPTTSPNDEISASHIELCPNNQGPVSRHNIAQHEFVHVSTYAPRTQSSAQWSSTQSDVARQLFDDLTVTENAWNTVVQSVKDVVDRYNSAPPRPSDASLHI
jgi:hypothetical protein